LILAGGAVFAIGETTGITELAAGAVPTVVLAGAAVLGGAELADTT
jgi:hypothetical protein